MTRFIEKDPWVVTPFHIAVDLPDFMVLQTLEALMVSRGDAVENALRDRPGAADQVRKLGALSIGILDTEQDGPTVIRVLSERDRDDLLEAFRDYEPEVSQENGESLYVNVPRSCMSPLSDVVVFESTLELTQYATRRGQLVPEPSCLVRGDFSRLREITHGARFRLMTELFGRVNRTVLLALYDGPTAIGWKMLAPPKTA